MGVISILSSASSYDYTTERCLREAQETDHKLRSLITLKEKEIESLRENKIAPAGGNATLSPQDGNTLYKREGLTELAKKIQPRPHDYKILNHAEVNGHLILELQYEHAVNYEGRKILVFDRGVTAIDLLQQRWIDPHFLDSKDAIYPIARFEPTERGRKWAESFCRISDNCS